MVDKDKKEELVNSYIDKNRPPVPQPLPPRIHFNQLPSVVQVPVLLFYIIFATLFMCFLMIGVLSVIGYLADKDIIESPWHNIEPKSIQPTLQSVQWVNVSKFGEVSGGVLEHDILCNSGYKAVETACECAKNTDTPCLSYCYNCIKLEDKK
jgi:hypothetical protein